MKLIWTRDSVCMGDDVNAPNTRTEEVDGPLTVSDLLNRAADYVPNMSGAVWSVWAENALVGYLEMSTSGYLLRDEPVLDGSLVLEPRRRGFPLDTLHVHCAHYVLSDFLYKPSLAEEYGQYPTLLDKVKAKERKQSGHGG